VIAQPLGKAWPIPQNCPYLLMTGTVIDIRIGKTVIKNLDPCAMIK